MSAAEMITLLIVGIVVVGPKKLPTMMRTAGQWVSKMRRMSSDLRSQSGIDRIIREEGLEKEIRELRALKDSLSKQALLDSLVKAADAANAPVKAPARVAAASPAALETLSAKTAAVAALTQSANEAAAAAATSTSATTSEPGTEPAASDKAEGAAPTAAAAAPAIPSGLYKPAQGAIPRGSIPSLRTRPLLVLPDPPRTPYQSVRHREFPHFGPDHYDALPDDLADDEEEQGELQASSSEAAALATVQTANAAIADAPSTALAGETTA
jgi:sec-independent protein translocase protein TatB